MLCDICKYKVEFVGYEDDEGGVCVMFCLFVYQVEYVDWSDVDDDLYVYDVFEKYVVVCMNQICVVSGVVIVFE